jgi:hypothetical protein
MVSPVGKSSSSSKQEETSKPKEKAEEPITSLSVPLKEVAAKTAAVLAWELRATKTIQHGPVAVLENGMPIWITTNALTLLMLRSSTFPHQAISKFRNVYEQIEGETWRLRLLRGLRWIALFFRHTDDDTVRQRYVYRVIEFALLSGPASQLGCWKRLLYDYSWGLYIPAEWREQVEELAVALKALTAAQASLMFWEMWQLLDPRPFHRLGSRPALAKKEGTEERCEKTEFTESDSESTASGSYSTY